MDNVYSNFSPNKFVPLDQASGVTPKNTIAKNILYQTLSRGLTIIKHGRKGAPKMRILYCDFAVTKLYWSENGIDTDAEITNEVEINKKSDAIANRSINISDIIEIRAGTDIDPDTSSTALKLAAKAGVQAAVLMLQRREASQIQNSSKGGKLNNNDGAQLPKRTFTQQLFFGSNSNSKESDETLLYGTATLRRTCKPEDLPLCISLILPERSFDIQCLNKGNFNFLLVNLREVFNKLHNSSSSSSSTTNSVASAASITTTITSPNSPIRDQMVNKSLRRSMSAKKSVSFIGEEFNWNDSSSNNNNTNKEDVLRRIANNISKDDDFADIPLITGSTKKNSAVSSSSDSVVTATTTDSVISTTEQQLQQQQQLPIKESSSTTTAASNSGQISNNNSVQSSNNNSTNTSTASMLDIRDTRIYTVTNNESDNYNNNSSSQHNHYQNSPLQPQQQQQQQQSLLSPNQQQQQQQSLLSPNQQQQQQQQHPPVGKAVSTALQIGQLLAQQEAAYGTNMYLSLRPGDEPEISRLVSEQGLTSEEAVLHIFYTRYLPSSTKTSSSSSSIASSDKVMNFHNSSVSNHPVMPYQQQKQSQRCEWNGDNENDNHTQQQRDLVGDNHCQQLPYNSNNNSSSSNGGNNEDIDIRNRGSGSSDRTMSEEKADHDMSYYTNHQQHQQYQQQQTDRRYPLGSKKQPVVVDSSYITPVNGSSNITLNNNVSYNGSSSGGGSSSSGFIRPRTSISSMSSISSMGSDGAAAGSNNIITNSSNRYNNDHNLLSTATTSSVVAAEVASPSDDAAALQIGLLLSQQEQQYGINMYDALGDEDEAAIRDYVQQGYTTDEAILEIFHRKYGMPTEAAPISRIRRGSGSSILSQQQQLLIQIPPQSDSVATAGGGENNDSINNNGSFSTNKPPLVQQQQHSSDNNSSSSNNGYNNSSSSINNSNRSVDNVNNNNNQIDRNSSINNNNTGNTNNNSVNTNNSSSNTNASNATATNNSTISGSGKLSPRAVTRASLITSLSEDEALQMAILLSQQEEEFGINMYDAIQPGDDAEIQQLMSEGYTNEEAVFAIFQRRYHSEEMQSQQQQQQQVYVDGQNHNTLMNEQYQSLGINQSSSQYDHWQQQQQHQQASMYPQHHHNLSNNNNNMMQFHAHRNNIINMNQQQQQQQLQYGMDSLSMQSSPIPPLQQQQQGMYGTVAAAAAQPGNSRLLPMPTPVSLRPVRMMAPTAATTTTAAVASTGAYFPQQQQQQQTMYSNNPTLIGVGIQGLPVPPQPLSSSILPPRNIQQQRAQYLYNNNQQQHPPLTSSASFIMNRSASPYRELSLPSQRPGYDTTGGNRTGGLQRTTSAVMPTTGATMYQPAMHVQQLQRHQMQQPQQYPYGNTVSYSDNGSSISNSIIGDYLPNSNCSINNDNSSVGSGSQRSFYHTNNNSINNINYNNSQQQMIPEVQQAVHVTALPDEANSIARPGIVKKRSMFNLSRLGGGGGNGNPFTAARLKYKESDVKAIMDMGYCRDQAVWALVQNQNNVPMALESLLNS